MQGRLFFMLTFFCPVLSGQHSVEPVFDVLIVALQQLTIAAAEFVPGIDAGPVEADKNRDVGGNGKGDGIAQAAAFAFGFTEFVENQDIGVVIERGLDKSGNVTECGRVEAAALRMAAEVLGNGHFLAADKLP